MKFKSAEQALEVLGNKKCKGETMHFFNKGAIFLTKPDEFPQLLLQRAIFIAKRHSLALSNGYDFPAPRTGELQIRQHRAIFVKKPRVLPQILDYLVIIQRHLLFDPSPSE